MTGRDLVNCIEKNNLYDRHIFIGVEGNISPIGFISETKNGDLFIAQEGMNENDIFDNCNNKERYFSEWFNIISYAYAKKLWENDEKIFLVLRSDGTDCYAECYDKFEDIPGDALLGFDKY